VSKRLQKQGIWLVAQHWHRSNPLWETLRAGDAVTVLRLDYETGEFVLLHATIRRVARLSGLVHWRSASRKSRTHDVMPFHHIEGEDFARGHLSKREQQAFMAARALRRT